MNRFIYVLLLSAITILGFIMYQHQDPGFISFRFAGYTFETNLIVFTAAVLCFIFSLLLLLKTWQSLNHFAHYIINRRQHRLQQKAHASLSRGLIEYAEGRFEQAEKILLQQIKYSDNRLLVYLSAARAAQQLGAHERRDDYLRKAHKEAPDADIAIGLTKVELQLAHEQNEQALATLSQLNNINPNHSYVLTLLASTYNQLQDWDNLQQLLPSLKKHSKLSAEKLLNFEIAICNGQLTKLCTHKDAQLLIKHWNDCAHHLKILPTVTEHYARQLLLLNFSSEAENVLRLYLEKNWQENIIILYSELEVSVDNKQLEMAEGWLNDHQHNAWLLLALGKMCVSLALWGKARSYLEASIAIKTMPENHLKLAQLLEQHMDEEKASQEYYRLGLLLLADNSEAKPPQKILDSEIDSPVLKIVKI